MVVSNNGTPTAKLKRIGAAHYVCPPTKGLIKLEEVKTNQVLPIGDVDKSGSWSDAAKRHPLQDVHRNRNAEDEVGERQRRPKNDANGCLRRQNFQSDGRSVGY